MSVAQLSADHLARFLAPALRMDIIDAEQVGVLARAIAIANANAWAERYDDTIQPADFDETSELAAKLAEDDGCLVEFEGGVSYNTVWPDTPAGQRIADLIDQLEKQVGERCRSLARQFKRAEENAVAYNEVGQLPMVDGHEIARRCRAAGCERVIVARFMVNESDCQTDYFGGRKTREVIIGFGKGKRESFAQLRKAAAKFPPTAEFGPGCDRWEVEAGKNPELDGPDAWRRGEIFRTVTGPVAHFTTEAAARAAVAEVIATSPECADDYVGGLGFPWFAQHFGFTCHKHSVENRENWSMGGGNYLGNDRYSGWKVTSVSVACYDHTHQDEVHGV